MRTSARAGLAIVVILGGGGPAMAQAASSTLLHLSASGAVQASPDQLRAELTAQSTSAAAAEAQLHVNTLMGDALRTAERVNGIAARAVGYSVNPADEKRSTWTAQQTLELRGTDGPVLLDLVGRLQAKGFAVSSLAWELSPQLRRKSHDEATTAALRELQTRAAAAAATLGLHVDHLQDVRLSAPMLFQPRAAMQAMAARAAPPPQATATPEEVTAEVSADVVLLP